MDKLRLVLAAALICLALSTAALAATWIIGSPLIYHVKDLSLYQIGMTGSPPAGDIALNTEITFTISLNYSSSPVSGATVYLYNGETQLKSGTTNGNGICILTYTVTPIGDYTFTPRYSAP